MLNIQPGQSLSATFKPCLLPNEIPASYLIPWIGSRNRWTAVHAMGFTGPQLLFILDAGTDGLGVAEEFRGRPLRGPELVVGIRALRGVVVEGPDGEATP